MIARTVLYALGLALAAPLAGEKLLRTFEWPDPTPAGKVLPADAGEARPLEVRRFESRPATIALLVVDAPPISRPRYALRGEIRYEGVEGDGYLELWNVFASDRRYFSRTLADRGPMSKITGGAGWRTFLLPFFNEQGAPPPRRLELNLFLPGRGAVWIGPLELVQYGEGEDPFAQATGAWWTDSQAGLVGGILGAVLGIGGAIVGIAASRGRGRRFVLALLGGMIGLGGILLPLGLVAWGKGQPYAVTYTLLLIGVLCLAIAGPQLRRVRRLYQENELRRMRALDVR